MGGLRSALTQFQKLFHVDACDARGVRLPASSPITPSNVGVSVWTPTSRTSAQRRALPSVATPPAGAYLFILFICDHLTEYFTNLMILLYMNIIFAAAARSRSSPQQQRRQQPTRRTAKYPQFPITKTGTNKFTVRVLLIDAGVEASKHGRAIAAILGPKGAKRRTSFFSSHFVSEYFTHFNINISCW